MLLAILAILAGFIVLAWSADRFVDGAAALASHFGVSPLIIGLTIVGFGTSAPELVVSALAALGGNPGLAVGNAIGSNIANVGLVLGIGAVLAPLTVGSAILRREFPVMGLALLMVLIVLLDGQLGLIEGIILLISLLVIIAWTVHTGIRESRQASVTKLEDPLQAEFEQELAQVMPMMQAVLWLIIGGAFMVASSRLLVWGAVQIATLLGISDLLIGLTIVAIGTSLPEVAATVASVFKGENDIAIGNVIGSNIFNSLGVIGLAGILHPTVIDKIVLTRDIPMMLGITVLLYIILYRSGGIPCLSRIKGIVLLMLYCSYLALLVYQATV
ncbi:MAG TPA: calcium/sodium antiporter [Gammaproteobacteria bacterium]|nr:calcium/sodium antiporter [Gammaproteobacteria bacterium]